MSLNRREMLRLGAAGAGGLLLSVAASSQIAIAAVDLARPPIGSACAGSAARRRPDRAGRHQSDAVPQGQGGARFARIGFATAISSASSISRWARASRASTSSTCRAARSKAIRVAHGRGSDPDHTRLPRAFLEPVRLGSDVERRLHHRRDLSRQIRAFDEGPRPRLVQQQCRSRARSSSTTPGMPSRK